MRKRYDDFTQLKLKDMCKEISEMTYKYINPDTNEPTVVPAIHYEKDLNRVQEQYMGEITSRQFLLIMYNQLSALKKEDEKYFNQALLCMDMGLNPKSLKISEQIALNYTYNYLDDKIKTEKKNFHIFSDDVVNTFNESLTDPEFQSRAVQFSNLAEKMEDKDIRDVETPDTQKGYMDREDRF